jgi:hypothetical protein
MAHADICGIRQHTSAYGSIRQHTSEYVSSKSAYVHHRTLLNSLLQASFLVLVRQHTSAYVSIRQQTPAYVSIPCRPLCSLTHTPCRTCHSVCSMATPAQPYVRIHQHTPAMPRRTCHSVCSMATPAQPPQRLHTSAYGSICQHTSAYVSIRQHTSGYVSIPSAYRQHTSAYVSIRQHTVSIRQHTSAYRQHTSAYRQHTCATASALAGYPAGTPKRSVCLDISLQTLRRLRNSSFVASPHQKL